MKRPSKIACQNVWKLFGAATEQMSLSALQQGDLSRLSAEGQVVAVRDVTFAVETGETFVIMGLSGSGKSTLIRCISRLIEPSAGQILIDDQDILKMSAAELLELRRHRMSMVFQHFGLLPHRRVMGNVAFGLEVQGFSRAEREVKAQEMISLVGLNGWERNYPHELSGGMQQRVGLARALALDPDILLCDEPFSALDPLIRGEMQDELLRLQEMMHKTILFITHDFEEALRLGDRIGIMRDGALVQVGTAEEIVSRPANDYVAAFTRNIPRQKVLTAKTVMVPAKSKREKVGDKGRYALVTATLEALIPLVATTAEPLAIIDEEGYIVGQVSPQQLLTALGEGQGDTGL
ncbi:MAG TPA: glycine betaine/L-proline ABC transporter ATP-binding protein [Anaerolineae bacterium]|nr:glycine betaine/L-proline ABC transporter ATP-binding protein [Anaerolineae bacterium]